MATLSPSTSIVGISTEFLIASSWRNKPPTRLLGGTLVSRALDDGLIKTTPELQWDESALAEEISINDGKGINFPIKICQLALQLNNGKPGEESASEVMKYGVSLCQIGNVQSGLKAA